MPHAQKPAALAQWASSHYAPLPPGAAITRETMSARAVLPARAPTVCALPPDELAATFEPGVIDRSGLILKCTGLPEVLQANARRALCEADVLPGVDVVALWCDESVWLCVWGAKMLQDVLAEESVESERKRLAGLVRLEGANHFVSASCLCSSMYPLLMLGIDSLGRARAVCSRY